MLHRRGCGTVKDAVRGPKLTDMSSHALAASMQASPAVIASSAKPAAPPAASTANSLWRPGARAFFIDQRASKPGDILTVLINIDDSAKLQNNTTSSRQNATKGEISHVLGLETALAKIMPKGFDPTNALAESPDLIPVAMTRTPLEAAPVSGAIYGDGGRSELTVHVDVRPAQSIPAAA